MRENKNIIIDRRNFCIIFQSACTHDPCNIWILFNCTLLIWKKNICSREQKITKQKNIYLKKNSRKKRIHSKISTGKKLKMCWKTKAALHQAHTHTHSIQIQSLARSSTHSHKREQKCVEQVMEKNGVRVQTNYISSSFSIFIFSAVWLYALHLAGARAPTFIAETIMLLSLLLLLLLLFACQMLAKCRFIVCRHNVWDLNISARTFITQRLHVICTRYTSANMNQL